MGNCSLYVPRYVKVGTAKLILQDGEIEEFSRPVKVSLVLQRNPKCFICNADEMDFDQFLSAVDGEEELQPGQLYFVLPLSWLTRRMQAEDMASLVNKASAALTRSARETCGCGIRRADPLISCDGREIKSRRMVDAAASGGGDGSGVELLETKRGRGGGACGGKGRKFTTNLGVIIEE